MTFKPLNKITLSIVGLVLFVFVSANTAFADCPHQIKASGEDALQMLVIGDSIMWGQGLKDDEKFTSRVKCWLQEQTNREVKLHMEAHSGAIISGSAAVPPNFTSSDGEVNLVSPTNSWIMPRSFTSITKPLRR